LDDVGRVVGKPLEVSNRSRSLHRVIVTSTRRGRHAIRRETAGVFIVHGTKKFVDRTGGATARDGARSTTKLGDWYATVLFWKPQLALFVNETTLLPVLVPLAPAATVLDRFPEDLANLLRALEVDRAFVDPELTAMRESRLAKTQSRSVLGAMNEFVRMAGYYREDTPDFGLVELSLWLAEVPCGPLRSRHGSPDRELLALVSQRREP
jgi:hypothetical protein